MLHRSKPRPDPKGDQGSRNAPAPPDEIVYLLIFDDGAGTALMPFAAARKLAETANAPIFSHWNSLIGSGILGGYLLSGERVGKIAARAIKANVEQQPFSVGEHEAFVYVYDWDQLQRWGISQDRLQPQTLIHNRPPDLWLVFKREIIVLGIFSVGLFISLFLFQRNRLFKRMNAELRRLSMTDALTGLLNRRAFDLLIDNELSRCQRVGNHLSFLIFDLDHFKRINDQYGHPMGDLILATVAGTLQQAIRRTDHLARWGGEEFVLLAVDSDLHQASLIAEKIRETVQAIPFEDQIRVTVSIGVAEYQPHETVDHFCARADAALYRAKREGRNRVVIDPIR